MINWKQSLKEKWATLGFGDVMVQIQESQHLFEVVVYLNGLDPKAVRVELYADGVMVSAPAQQVMTRVRQLAGVLGSYVYTATVSAARPSADYTARIIPHCVGVAVPLELAPILWQR